MVKALNDYGQFIQRDLPKRTISYAAQQTKDRLEQDTPVITGQLKGSTTIEKGFDGQKQTLGQSAPYAAMVNVPANGVTESCDICRLMTKPLSRSELLKLKLSMSELTELTEYISIFFQVSLMTHQFFGGS